MYTEAELRVLATLQGERTLSNLAHDLDRSLSYVSELITQLETKRLVHTVKDGKTKRVRRADSRAIELFDGFIQRHQHLPFPELLGGSTLQVLYFLDTPATSGELASRANIHRSTVHRSLQPLVERGLVYRADGAYALNDQFVELATLAKEFGHHKNRSRIDAHDDSYTILWESLDEFLVQTDAEIDAEQFQLTGPERFDAFDLPLLSRERRYYLYTQSPRELGVSDVCCHMLLIDAGTRSQSYCLLLLAATDVDRTELLSVASTYDVTELVSDLLTYLDTNGADRSESLPTWTEFEALAAEYEVAL